MFDRKSIRPFIDLKLKQCIFYRRRG